MRKIGQVFLVMAVVMGLTSQAFALPRRIHKMYEYKPPKCELNETVNQQAVAKMIDELGRINLGKPAADSDTFGFEARNRYYLIRCYAEKLGLALEDFGASEDGLKKMVRERIIESQAERMKIVRSEALEVLAMIEEKGSREKVRPLIFRDHRQNMANINELIENGREFGIGHKEVGLWGGEIQVLQKIEDENPSILMAMMWKKFCK